MSLMPHSTTAVSVAIPHHIRYTYTLITSTLHVYRQRWVHPDFQPDFVGLKDFSAVATTASLVLNMCALDERISQ